MQEEPEAPSAFSVVNRYIVSQVEVSAPAPDGSRIIRLFSGDGGTIIETNLSAQREGIAAAIRHGLSNARVEAINTQIRLIARRAFGFHSPQALISLAMLKLGGLCPPLPGRVTVT